MNQKEFLAHLQTGRTAWEIALAQIPTAQIDQPKPGGGWSVKDHIAHLAFFEREMLNLLRTRSLELASPLWNLPQDERNQQVYEQNRARPLSEVYQDEAQIYAELLPLLQALTDEDLNEPARLGMPPDWLPWQILAGNTYQHYLDHAEMLRGFQRD